MNGKVYLKPEISAALRIISFVAAVCVVMIHANSDGKWDFICHTLTSWAVPFFFACSGFFFGIGDYVRGGGYISLMRKKFWSLLVPYVAWTLIGSVICVGIVVVVNYKAGLPLFERTFIARSGFWNVFDGLFGVTSSAPRNYGVLWFVRCLLMLFVAAPLWRLLCNKWTGWIFVVLFGLKYFIPHKLYMGDFEFKYNQTAWFFMGVALAIYIPRSWMYVETVTDKILAPKVCGYSFWIYCSHAIFITVVVCAWHAICGKTKISLWCLFPVALVFALLMSLLGGIMMKRYCPRGFAILSGGR